MSRLLLPSLIALLGAMPSFAAPDARDPFTSFESWASQYRAAKNDFERSELRYAGLPLAVSRRAALLALMGTDPKAALERRMTRDGMPVEVAAQLELPLDGFARFEVLGVLKRDGKGGIERRVVLGGMRYQVTGYGKLLQLKTLDNLAVHGIALGDVAALDDSHVQRIGGTQASPWTVGLKRMRFIRVDFSDAAGDPLTVAQATTLTNNLGNYLRDASYGKTSLNVTVLPMTLRMPRTKAAYNSANDTDGLLRDARAAATNAGYPGNMFELDVLAFGTMPSWDWSGLGFIGQSGSWLNGSFSLGTVAHEVGHNYGLYHANFWQAGNETITGAGSSLEYGNPFEIMGDGDGHYNAWYKWDLDWFNPSEVAVVTSSNQFRVYDLEELIAGGTHALRVPIGTSSSQPNDYWVEYRPGAGGQLARAASINWGYRNTESSDLLDMQPWTATADDSGLVVGRTFSDFTTGIHITPIAVAATMPAALDIVVNRGLFATNHAPTVTLACAQQGGTLDCTATAMDQDADTLAYFWDFGDNSASTNAATQSRTFAGARDVLARVTVTDMKGGTATASAPFKFGNPATFRISGTVTEGGVGVEGVRVFSANRTTVTNSDGTYTLVGVAPGSVSLSARKTGFSFVAGFTNPVTVSAANLMNINFTASRATYTISGRVTSIGTGFPNATVSAGRYSTTTSSNGDYTLTGVPAGAYQLEANGPNGENFVVSGFTNPVQITNMSLTNRNFFELVFPVTGRVTGVTGPHLVSDGTRNANSALNGAAYTWTLPKVPPGTYNLVANAAGQIITPTSFQNPVTVSSTGLIRDATNTAKTSLDFDSVSGTAYLISGYVDEFGAPSLGVSIDAGVVFGGTDSRGIYVLQGLPAGQYTLSAFKPGYVFGPLTRDVTLPNPDGGNDDLGADFTVTFANVPPGFAFPPHATPSPVPGTVCNLVTLGRDPVEDESTLKYTWTQVFGTTPVNFSVNGTNASKSTQVTFTRPGAYAFEVKVADPSGLFATANVTVLVLQTTTAVTVTPSTTTVDVGAFRQFVAGAKDQFGQTIDFGGEATWSVDPEACGTITQTGKFQGVMPGTCTVTALVDSKTGTSAVTVQVGAAPRVLSGPTANPNPVTGSTTELTVTADDDEGEAQLNYTWKMVNGPAGVSFSVNGTNAAKTTTATFTAAGSYDLQVEVKDSRDIATSAFLPVTVMGGGLARIEVTGPASVAKGSTGQFVAKGKDLAGMELAVSGCTWSTTAGTIDGSGVLTPAQTGTVTATCNGLTGSANVTVTEMEEKKGCGCTTGEGAFGLLAGFALLLRRRRASGQH